jgi:hypothetical protein
MTNSKQELNHTTIYIADCWLSTIYSKIWLPRNQVTHIQDKIYQTRPKKPRFKLTFKHPPVYIRLQRPRNPITIKLKRPRPPRTTLILNLQQQTIRAIHRPQNSNQNIHLNTHNLGEGGVKVARSNERVSYAWSHITCLWTRQPDHTPTKNVYQHATTS